MRFHEPHDLNLPKEDAARVREIAKATAVETIDVRGWLVKEAPKAPTSRTVRKGSRLFIGTGNATSGTTSASLWCLRSGEKGSLASTWPRSKGCRLVRAAVVLLGVVLCVPADSEDYLFTHFVGSSGGAGWYDGKSSEARFGNPEGVAIDRSGATYVADTLNHVIRKITPDGTVTTLAGLAGSGGYEDGARSAARFYYPRGLAVDAAGNVYVADADNNAIRKITPAGAVTTLAGSPLSGSADGTGSAARFQYPRGVAVDATGNVYVADTANCTIRKITGAGTVTTLAGLAGNCGSADGLSVQARFNYPIGLTVDAARNVWVADSQNCTIRMVTPQGDVVTAAGVPGSCSADVYHFANPSGVAVDDAQGRTYVTDGSAIRYFMAPPFDIEGVATLSGSPNASGSADGWSAARFSRPQGLALDGSGHIFVADTENNTIRKVTLGSVSIQPPLVTTVAGLAAESGSTDAIGSSARFSAPGGVAVDASGNMYVADSRNNTIRRVTAAGAVTTFAGLGGSSGYANGTGASARFFLPTDVAVDTTGNVYVADMSNGQLRKITPAGVVTTLSSTPSCANLTVDGSNNIYMSESGKNVIWKRTPAGWWTTLAGLSGSAGSTDGTGSAARFWCPSGLAADRAGNVYIADRCNHTIRKMTPAGTVSTIAGLAGSSGASDGTGSNARFNAPGGLAVDGSGYLFVTDASDNTIRKITPGAVVTTLAGYAGGSGTFGSADGKGSAGRFSGPTGVAVDSSGNVYVADSGNNSIRIGTPTILADAATIDVSVGAIGQVRYLGVSPQTAVGYGWEVVRRETGSGALLSSRTASNPTFTPDVAGYYVFRLTATGSGGVENISAIGLTVTNGTSPSASFSFTPRSPLSGQPIQFTDTSLGSPTGWLWDFGDGLTSTLPNPAHAFAFAGSYPVSLTVSNSAGSSFTQQLVTVAAAPLPPVAGFSWSPAVPYQNQAVQFTDLSTRGPTSWSWTFGDGATSNVQNPSHAFGTVGVFHVTLTAMSAYGSSTQMQTVTTRDKPVDPTGQFSAAYQDGSPVTYAQVTAFKNIIFTALDSPSLVDAGSYAWNFGDGTTANGSSTAIHAYAPGTFTGKLTVTKNGFPVSSTLALTVLASPEPPKWVVPGMAYVLGQVPWTMWQSDVTILNPDPTHAATYSLAFLDARAPVTDYSQLIWRSFTVPPLATIGETNALRGFFNQPLGAYGALMVRGDVAPLPPVITARTFNNGDPTKGTFGLSVPQTSTSAGVSAQPALGSSALIGLRQNTAAYTNIGLVNLHNDRATVALAFTDGATGAVIAGTTVTLNPYQSLQINNALQTAGFAGFSNLFTVWVRVLQGTSVYPYATVIDSGTSDPIVVTPTAEPSNAYRLPGIVRLAGANGEKWRSRVTVSNPSSRPRVIRLNYSYWACRAATDCFGETASGEMSMAPGQTVSWDDFVKVWVVAKGLGGYFAFDETAAYYNSFLDVSPGVGDADLDPLVVLGETYNDTPAGHVGLQIPGYTPADGLAPPGVNQRLVLTGLVGTAAYRTNLALFATQGTAGQYVTVHVYSASGTKLRDVVVAVFAFSFSQVGSETLFGGLPGDLSRLSVVVESNDHSQGRSIGAYATIIDNTSGDATFVKATPVPD